jgi:hypothetical protein
MKNRAHVIIPIKIFMCNLSKETPGLKDIII